MVQGFSSSNIYYSNAGRRNAVGSASPDVTATLADDVAPKVKYIIMYYYYKTILSILSPPNGLEQELYIRWR